MLGGVLAIRVTDTINLGAILIGVFVALPALFVLFKGAKWRAMATASEETARIYAEGQEAYRLKAERLESELKASLRVQAEQREMIAKLESLPNLTGLQERMGDLAETATRSILDALEHHEIRAEARHDALAAEHAKTQARAQAQNEKIVNLVEVVGHSLSELHKDIKNGGTK